MCGICCKISVKAENIPSLSSECLELFKNRGPDLYGLGSCNFDNCTLKFWATILHMRGNELCQQPLKTPAGNWFLFNGEIYGGLEVPEDRSDTEVLAEQIDCCSTEQEMLQVLAKIRGPWSFIFCKKDTQTVFFGRDALGRRSLLWSVDQKSHSIALASLAVDSECEWQELPSGCLFAISVPDEDFQVSMFPLRQPEPDLFQLFKQKFQKMSIRQEICSDQKSYLFHLNPDLPDSEVDLDLKITSSDHAAVMSKFCCKFEPESSLFLEKLSAAVRKRIFPMPTTCRNCAVPCQHNKVSVLFSGGVDSLLLAALVHKELNRSIDIAQSIDLFNVAFEQHDGTFNVPDRITGIQALQKLKLLYPERTWNFVQANVTKEELKFWREKRISKLLAPCQTVLDDSLGCALWFAARGRGLLLGTEAEFCSSSKILIQGSGADELLAGYARHRGRFQKEGWAGLISELEMELCRISSRNLGRDNRIIADHARESRLPYLDEEFMSFVNGMPIWQKANLYLDRGIGEKIILRLALWKLGFAECSLVAKRAMQFGSRIAKLENSKERADQICERLKNNSEVPNVQMPAT